MGGVDKASAKPVMSKRRALGDITNAVADEDSKGVAQNKKPPVFKPAVAEVHVAEAKEDMEDRLYMQRAVDDIDGRDNDNPLLCTSVVNQMYDHFAELEKEFMVKWNYMSKQDFVNEKMRCILADWLVSDLSTTLFSILVAFLFTSLLYFSSNLGRGSP